jgi:hypothetical protein
VRATAAAAYEAQGSSSGALEMLDHIAGDLAVAAQDDARLELADRLLEKGRLLNATYRFREALGELGRSLELQRENGMSRSWGPTGLELAWACYSLGMTDDAIGLIRESLPRTPLEGNRETLARAYGSLANMLRAGGRFEEAAQARETQSTLVGEGEGRAELLFETAMDARRRHGAASREARELLGWSRQAARAEGDSADRGALAAAVLPARGGARREQDCPTPGCNPPMPRCGTAPCPGWRPKRAWRGRACCVAPGSPPTPAPSCSACSTNSLVPPLFTRRGGRLVSGKPRGRRGRIPRAGRRVDG